MKIEIKEICYDSASQAGVIYSVITENVFGIQNVQKLKNIMFCLQNLQKMQNLLVLKTMQLI
jgi:hypothetical protein